MNLDSKASAEEDERKLKSLSTRIMSNGVEVLVKDKHNNGVDHEQRDIKTKLPALTPSTHQSSSKLKKLLSSEIATVVNRQYISALLPLKSLMHHHLIIKTCLTTYTYLTTIFHNKRSVISTFETIVSVVTTESLTDAFPSLRADIKPTRTKFSEVKTISPSAVINNAFKSNLAKIEKRIDDLNIGEDASNFDLIQPSEVEHTPCSSSCSCSNDKTESLKTKYNENNAYKKSSYKPVKYPSSKFSLKPTNKDNYDHKTQYPYEYESTSHKAPTDKIVEKYTEVINEYSDEKDSSVEQSELLTNEQAPTPPKTNKVAKNKPSDKVHTEKPQKINKNKFVVADLLKLGSLGIKKLSQLAPVFEKMTGSFIKRNENKTTTTTTTTTTVKPVTKITPYNVEKRIVDEIESKQNSFPIYIPVDEMEASESQLVFTNVTLHQNLAWGTDYKHPKSHNIIPPKIVHESPLVNGGIPISPGEIIRANSDVIVGKPAVGGPLTFAMSGIKLHNPSIPPPIDSVISSSEQHIISERPPSHEETPKAKYVDDSFDLRPPEPPQSPKINRNKMRLPTKSHHPKHQHGFTNNIPLHPPGPQPMQSEQLMKTEIKTSSMLSNHGRPAFLDYIPSLAKSTNRPFTGNEDKRPQEFKDDLDISDNSASSSEIIHTKVRNDGQPVNSSPQDSNKPFLVDIQPSKVANVLIPRGSQTALVFAGSSEPHKTGDYVDDPLPYPEPGYFGSFSIDAPQMTNVQSIASSDINPIQVKPASFDMRKPTYKEQNFRNEQKMKWRDNKRPVDFSKLPPPVSKQESHVQIGPQITVYNPEIYKPTNNGEFVKYNRNQEKFNKDGKEIIDKDYENYLAVPPPPPPKAPYDHFGNNKPFAQKPFVHTKPVQDMKVFLNIQHPIPQNGPEISQDQLPPKVTSEVYYAAQPPQNMRPSYSQQSNEQMFHNHEVSGAHEHYHQRRPDHHQYPLQMPNRPTSKPVHINEVKDDENTYSVTLNTATNVANDVSITGQVIGSSEPVSLESPQNMNANIPVGANFAIRVEDGPESQSQWSVTYNEKPNTHDHNKHINNINAIPSSTMSNNEWNVTSVHSIEDIKTNSQSTNHRNKIESHQYHQHDYDGHNGIQSVNSHANFPMMNENATVNSVQDVKPVTEYVDDVKPEQKRPGKLIPNLQTNSHGWYSSVNDFDKINNKHVETSTRKIIPLIPDYGKDNVPEFGQKIASIGKPPTELWAQTYSTENSGVGKPFSKPSSTAKTPILNSNFNKNTYDSNYILHHSGKQPVYDIPIRDNSEETTTIKPENSKPVYENAEEIYDGEEEDDQETDGEVSQESNKVPVVSISSKEQDDHITSSEITLLQDEILNVPEKKENNNVGSQTEKPFDAASYNKTHQFQSNAMKPMYNSNSHMRPRPFAVSTDATSDQQLHQPHWQINQLLENATNIAFEENFDLNIGEEMGGTPTKKPTTTTKKVPPRVFEVDNRYKKVPRPVFSVRPQKHNNDSIITSTINIQDRKPLTVFQQTTERVSSLPTFTITTSDFESNKTIPEMMDLSPPPSTLDYSFKPSTNDETIMGMSPPPPRSPTPVRPLLPTRSPITSRPVITPRTPAYRTKPPRTYPPRLPPQRTTRKPIQRDDISTYRPAYDIINGLRRPSFNRDQPSSQLLPPPMRDVISKPVSPIYEMTPSSVVTPPIAPQFVFPTIVSSGWLTSSGVGFSSAFDFEPSRVQYPKTVKPTEIVESTDKIKTETLAANDKDTTTTEYDSSSSETPQTDKTDSQETTQKPSTSSEDYYSSESSILDSEEEGTTTDSMKVVPLRNKNRTRKPYPVRNEDKKPNLNKYKPQLKPSLVIKPTRTISRADVLHPTRVQPIRRLPKPTPSRSPVVIPTEIESSESAVDDLYIKPTEVLKESHIPTSSLSDDKLIGNRIAVIESSIVNKEESNVPVLPSHNAGNEIKQVDAIIPTKTEFKTTVITLTKTLSEPPQIVSSIGYVNVTHTLTVTHTKTSLVTLSEGAVTQTLVLTNTHTSTLVDVITKVETQVLPTTIVETVTKHVPIQVAPTPVIDVPFRSKGIEDISISESSEDNDNLIIGESETTENIQKIDEEQDSENDTFFVVMNKSQNGGQAPPIVSGDTDSIDYGLTRNEQINSNGVSQVLFGEILLAGTPYLETTNVASSGGPYGKQCQPDCKASRNERCQRIDGIMKCVCRPGFARMFPDRPCKPTYTYSVKLALNSQGSQKLRFDQSLSDNSSKEYNHLALAAHEGLNRMIMQSDLRDVYHGVHINGFQPIDIVKEDEDGYKGVVNDFYVQLSDNAHENRLKEVIEKYLRNNNYSLGGTEVYAAEALMDKLEVNDFDECLSGQFHDCSEHAQCFNLRGTYTCSCLEGFADLSVNSMYPGRICSAEPVGCEKCNYHGSCYSRDDRVVLCECFQWYAGSSCHINLKVVLISLVTLGALLTIVLIICAIVACSKKPRQPPARSIVACIQNMPGLPQGGMPSKQQRADRRALINERTDSGDASSLQNASLPYIPANKKQSVVLVRGVAPPTHDPPPPPPPVCIPRARLHSHRDSRDHSSRKHSVEQCSEAKLISYLESGANSNDEMMRRKPSMESSYSVQKDRHNRQGALVSAGFKVSTTIKPDGTNMRDDGDDVSSINKNDLESELARFDSMRGKSYSQDNLSEWTDGERRMGELTLSEARSVGGTLPASTGRAASSTREAHTMAERDLGSTFLLPHVHLYKPDITSDVSEFDSL